MTYVLEVAGIVAVCSGTVALLGVGVLRLLRRHSVMQAFVAVAVLAVAAFVAGLLGTAQAMFLSSHDFKVTLVVSAVAGLVSLGIAFLLARQVVRGSEAVRRAARDLGVQGSYTPPGRTETTELAALSRELENASARLAEARRREQALEASRRDLVAWVSHDLRTPLAGLRAMAEALEDGVADDPARYHTRIRSEVERLARMVDDLFELARIHSGALRLSIGQVSLPDLVNDTLVGADPLARAKGVRLGGSVDPRVGTVDADAAALSRVLTNLVANAIQHTPHDGTVVLTTGMEETGVLVSVTDGCGGIPEPDLDRVFDVAWRGSSARTPDVGRADQPATSRDAMLAGTSGAAGAAGGGSAGGAGLGLAIVRGIVEAHSGTVQVQNVGPGCRFDVRLPFGRATAGV